MDSYPKRLIEVDLPIARISAHARREKSIRHGHISTLHIWWARRPLAACRAVICASLWPDPEDLASWLKEAEAGGAAGKSGPEIRAPRGCKLSEGVLIRPRRFLDEARKRMTDWAQRHMKKASAESMPRQVAVQKDHAVLNDSAELRRVLLDFIADFANWDNSTDPAFLETARALTQAAHETLGGEPGTQPLVVDPFAGGGAIPLEALRVGADAFASDLNPVAVLLNKVILEYIPKHGRKLADEVRKWGEWIKEQAEKELAEFYPNDPDGATPIAYLWARTVKCEAPDCGVDIPLLRTLWLSRRGGNSAALVSTSAGAGESATLRVFRDPKIVERGFTSGNSATCGACGYTTPVARVRHQLYGRNGGSADGQLVAVVTRHPSVSGKQFRHPSEEDLRVLKAAELAVASFENEMVETLPLIPNEACPPEGALGFRFQKYGITAWRYLYTPRQLLTLCVFTRLVGGTQFQEKAAREAGDELAAVVQSVLALAVGRLNDRLCTLCRWRSDLNYVEAANGGQNKMPMLLDFAESTPFGGGNGGWSDHIEWIVRVLNHVTDSHASSGIAQQGPAQVALLPEDSAHAVITDPPYFDAFGYSDLSEFFHIWLRRAVPPNVCDLRTSSVPKHEEAVSIGKELDDGRGMKDASSYCAEMTASFETARKTAIPGGVGVVVFANKTTAGWEAILESLMAAGWVVSASWPIDTELANRQRALGSAALNSSVHIVCRPRENPDGSVREDDVGEWREVLGELPKRIHAWMPRLAAEGVVGADAIFACIGPALEVFSQYSRVEKASGEAVTLGEYLEQVWAAVSNEALSLLFKDADASGLEPDARLTAMWLWTLGAGAGVKAATTKGAAAAAADGDAKDDTADNDEEPGVKKAGGKPSTGYELEFDAARKIAQGLGAHLDKLSKVVEVKGDKARLLSVSERTRHLFGKDAEAGQPRGRRKKKDPQLGLFAELEAAEEMAESGAWALGGMPMGQTALDRIHQAMILFAAGRGEALKRFLVEDGAGTDARFWKLAQSLSALYPAVSDEKRWVDGVLGRKKGLGL